MLSLSLIIFKGCIAGHVLIGFYNLKKELGSKDSVYSVCTCTNCISTFEVEDKQYSIFYIAYRILTVQTGGTSGTRMKPELGRSSGNSWILEKKVLQIKTYYRIHQSN